MITPQAIMNMMERSSRGDSNTVYNDDERCILHLMRDVQVINSHVGGSSSSHLRNEIRMLMTHLGMPSFFITINPADIYSPILKFLALQNIDIDNLKPEEIPNYWSQVLLIAHNPAIAAKFFNIFMKSFIKTLLKFDQESELGEGGILGHVKGYYGCVEAQGRGSLHCHMLVWIEGSLNPDDLKVKIVRDDDFRLKLAAYLEDIIFSDVPFDPLVEILDGYSSAPPLHRRNPFRVFFISFFYFMY